MDVCVVELCSAVTDVGIDVVAGVVGCFTGTAEDGCVLPGFSLRHSIN